MVVLPSATILVLEALSSGQSLGDECGGCEMVVVGTETVPAFTGSDAMAMGMKMGVTRTITEGFSTITSLSR